MTNVANTKAPLSRRIASRCLWTGVSVLKSLGVSVSPSRNAANKLTGLTAQWGTDEPSLTRGILADHVIDGRPVRFFVSDENDGVQQFHVQGRWYEEEELALIARHFNGGTFVNLGANVCNHSLYAALVLNADKIVAFEPNPPAHRGCLYNFLLNSLGDRAVLHRIGLSDVSERAAVAQQFDRNLGATRLATGTGDLELRRGDEMLADERVDFIKIDVESLEMKVLRGLERIMAEQRPRMLVEVDDENWSDFEQFVGRAGYGMAETIKKFGNTNVLLAPL